MSAHTKALPGAFPSSLEAANAVSFCHTFPRRHCPVSLEVVTPRGRAAADARLVIEYGVHETPFGAGFIAMTARGLCNMTFVDSEGVAAHLTALQGRWPLAEIKGNQESTRAAMAALLAWQEAEGGSLSLYVSGTDFQARVWRALLTIAPGQLASYGQIAQAIGQPRAARAVGLAAGANPVALLIPCHRVIRQDGGPGGYRWGCARKQAILAWEAARSGR